MFKSGSLNTLKIGYQQTYPQFPQKNTFNIFTKILQLLVNIRTKNDIKL